MPTIEAQDFTAELKRNAEISASHSPTTTVTTGEFLQFLKDHELIDPENSTQWELSVIGGVPSEPARGIRPLIAEIPSAKPKDPKASEIADDLKVWEDVLNSGRSQAIRIDDAAINLGTEITDESTNPRNARRRLFGIEFARTQGVIGDNTAENMFGEISDVDPRDDEIVAVLPDVTDAELVDDERLSDLIDTILTSRRENIYTVRPIGIANKPKVENIGTEILEDKENKRQLLTKNSQKAEEGQKDVGRLENAKVKLNALKDRALERIEKIAQPTLEPRNDEVKIPGTDFEIITDKVLGKEPLTEESLKGLRGLAIRIVQYIKEHGVPPKKSTREIFASVLVAVGMLIPNGLLATMQDKSSSEKDKGRTPATVEGKIGGIFDLPFTGENENSFVQEIGKIVYPPGINPDIWEPSVQMPENPELYRFMTLQDEGDFGVGGHDTPPDERYGNSELIGTTYTVAKAFHEKFKDTKLIVADLNAPGHDSHKTGRDVDIYMENGGLKIGGKNYDKDRAVELGIMFMKTGKIDLIFYNDEYVIERVNRFAEEKGLSGRMQASPKHDVHMHVRIVEKEAKIDIPWMPEQVKRWNDIVIAKAKKYSVDPEFVSIIMYKESAGNPRAGSGVGAQGLMQIMPETARSIARELGIANYDIWDPETNIEFGTYYLGQLLKKFGKPDHAPSWDKSILLAAIGYNGGPGAAESFLRGRIVKEQGPFCESREYGYYVLGMWRERHAEASKHFEELHQIGHRCNLDPTSYPIDSLK